LFFELIKRRRSIRLFQERAVEKEKIDLLLKAALYAPSSRSLFPCRYIVVSDPSLLNALSRAKKHGAEFLGNAPLGIVVSADPDECDVWIEDASIAALYIHLAAVSLGLGSCWIQIRKRSYSHNESSQDYIKKLLSLPGHFRVLAIVVIGYPAEELPPHTVEDLRHNKVFLNGFDRKYGW
jgi:nitroreductase